MMGDWVTIGPLPQGPQGEPGAPGEPGATGPQGEPGPAGSAGPQGEPGAPGEPGATGPQGDRFFVYGEQPGGAPNLLQLYWQRQALIGGDWEPQGFPVPMPLLSAPAGEPGEPGAPGAPGQPGPALRVRFWQEEGVPFIAYPQGQWMAWDSQAGEYVPFGEWFSLGDIIVAPQGPAGAPGEPGATGPAGPAGLPGPQGAPGDIPILPHDNEWESWSYAALSLAYVAAHLHASYFNADVEAMRYLAARMAGQFNGLSSSIVSAIPSASPNYVSALTSFTTVEEVAKQLFCWMINNPLLPSTDILLWRDTMPEDETALWKVDGMEVEHLLLSIADSAARRPDRFRAAIRALRAEGATDVRPDYSYLPCTPVIEDWNHVFDFQNAPSLPAGWIINSGQFVPGEGIRSGQWGALVAYYAFPAMTGLTQAEIIAGGPQEPGSYARAVANLPGSYHQLAGTNFAAPGGVYIGSWNGLFTASSIGLDGNMANTLNYIRRLSIAGRGANPFSP